MDAARRADLVVTSGGIGHNFELMRANWPTERVGPAPAHMIAGDRNDIRPGFDDVFQKQIS